MLGGYSALAKVLANDLPSSLYTSMSFRIATQRMIYRRSGRGR